MDGSTSMRVRDMGTDRWQRAMQWVRTLTKTLSWNGDRMALATFADIAVPQVRLTRDPNTILFFLDHLDDAPMFRLENETSWNTNVEDAIYWGVKLVETDQEMYGPARTRARSSSFRTARCGAATCSAPLPRRRSAAFRSMSSASARRTAA